MTEIDGISGPQAQGKDEPRAYDMGRALGVAVQIGLGVLLGYSAIENVGGYYRQLLDTPSLLLVSLAMLVTTVPFASKPKFQIPTSRLTKIFTIAGLLWYGVFSAASYVRFHHGVFFDSADKPQAMWAIAMIFLPVAVIVIAITGRARGKQAVPYWAMASLAAGVWGLPFNEQLGQLPVCILGLMTAFLAGFAAREVRALLLSAVTACSLLLAFSLTKYLNPSMVGNLITHLDIILHRPAVLPYFFPRLGIDTAPLVHPNLLGHHLVLIIAAAAASLGLTSSKRNRQSLIMLIAFVIMCLLLTQSRGGILGLIAMLLLIVWYYVRAGKMKLIATIGLTSSATMGLLAVIHLSMQRGTSNILRMTYWDWAMRQFFFSPLIGNGTSSFPASWDRHIRTGGIALPSQWHCFSLFWETLCDTGLVGLLTLGLVIYSAYRVFRMALDHMDSGGERSALIICACGICGYLVSMLVDVMSWLAMTPAVPILVGAWMGFASSRSAAPAPSNGSVRSYNLARYTYVVLLLMGLAIAASTTSCTVPAVCPDFKTKLCQRWFGSPTRGSLP